MEHWNTKKSAELYGINHWGSGYFRINEFGNVEVTPYGENSARLDLRKLVDDLRERGIRIPILLRFPDIIRSRIELLANCFTNAIKECDYKGNYCGIFPIKVNQQRHLIDEIMNLGHDRQFGLECGSKPELLIALAFAETRDSLIICNGFKDRDYIEMALISQKLGHRTFIVIDRMSEMPMVIEAARKLQIKPNIGLRAKLTSQTAGRWSETSGARSKFGLTPSEMVTAVQMLKDADMLSCLQLLHFHTGSQIPSIQAIKSTIKEGARFYTELYAMGAFLQYIDVGGGLGVDYDSSGRSNSSTNYDEQEYANDVVSIIQTICDEKNTPHPDIISESGRSLVAHSSALIFDVLGVNEVARQDVNLTVTPKESPIVRELYEIYESVDKNNFNEYYNDLIEKKRDTLQMFAYGVLNLEQRAKAENIYWATITKMLDITRDMPDAEDIFWELQRELSDTYFCNFSVFQSLPDSWAVDHIFPVMPIHRLDTKPERRATLVDLTCDSDGSISRFIDTDTGDTQSYLEVHDLKKGEPYYMAVFLTGAYQEILGDLHNLFGDTDAVHVTLNENGYYTVDHLVRGDSVSEVLEYVEYNKHEMVERVRRSTESSIFNGDLSRSEARLLMRHYEQGLSGYTYLAQNREPTP